MLNSPRSSPFRKLVSPPFLIFSPAGSFPSFSSSKYLVCFLFHRSLPFRHTPSLQPPSLSTNTPYTRIIP